MPTTISAIEEVGSLKFPDFTGTRVMMLPIILGDPDSLPTETVPKSWHEPITGLGELAISMKPDVLGKVAYLTIDEAQVKAGTTHRRPGLHTDGYAEALDDEPTAYGSWGGYPGPWAPYEHPEPVPKTPRPSPPPYGPWGGYPGPWAPHNYEAGAWSMAPWAAKLGMLSVSSHVGCKAYNQTFDGKPGANGDSRHFEEQLEDPNKVILEPSRIYAMDGDTVHQSLIHRVSTARQFVRLSMPSEAAWYEGYTANPLGIQPAGPIQPPRPIAFMLWGDRHQ